MTGTVFISANHSSGVAGEAERLYIRPKDSCQLARPFITCPFAAEKQIANVSFSANSAGIWLRLASRKVVSEGVKVKVAKTSA